MKGKLLFVAGAAVGYVFGARAGRKRYEQIKGAAERIWETPGVQNQVEQVKDFAAQRVGEIPSVLADGAQKAFTALVTSRKTSARPSGSGSSRASDAAESAEPAPSAPAAAKSTTSAAKKTGTSSTKSSTKSGSASKSGTKSSSTSSTRAKSKPAADSE
jgi:hypothetical protein